MPELATKNRPPRIKRARENVIIALVKAEQAGLTSRDVLAIWDEIKRTKGDRAFESLSKLLDIKKPSYFERFCARFKLAFSNPK